MAAVKFIIFLIMFWELLIKWIPAGDAVYQGLRQVPDVVVLLLFFKTFFTSRVVFSSHELRAFNLLLIAFTCWALLVSIINIFRADILFELLNIKAMLRYTTVVFLIFAIRPSADEIQNLIKFCLALVVMQVLVGCIQFIGGIAVRNFLAARFVLPGFDDGSNFESINQVKNVNHLIGTFGDPISFAYFILFGCCLVCTSTSKKYFKTFAILSILALMLLASGSRAATLMLPLLIGWRISVQMGKVRLTRVILVCIVGLIPFTYLLYSVGSIFGMGENNLSFLFVFSDRFIDAAMNQRLGVLLLLIPELLTDPNTLVGFGPDKFSFAEYANLNYSSLGFVLAAVLPYVLEDVYWVALFTYYGPIGLALWVALIVNVFAKSVILAGMKAGSVYSRVGQLTCALTVCMVTLGFLIPVFELKTISFNFWLFSGLTYYLSANLNAKKK